MAYDRTATANPPDWLRRVQNGTRDGEPADGSSPEPEAAAERVRERSEHVSMSAPTLTEKMAPQLAEADAAIREARDLRRLLSQVEEDRNVKSTLLEKAADLIDELEARNAVLAKENAGFRVRMKMFGEAALAIIEEVTKQSADSAYIPRGAQIVKPQQPVKPVTPRSNESDIEQPSNATRMMLEGLPLIVQGGNR